MTLPEEAQAAGRTMVAMVTDLVENDGRTVVDILMDADAQHVAMAFAGAVARLVTELDAAMPGSGRQILEQMGQKVAGV